MAQSMVTFLAWPRSVRTPFQLDAEVFGDGFAAGQDCDVLQHGLATIAKARGLDGATFSVPRSLFTTRVASASPSTSSAMITSGRPLLAIFRAKGSRSLRLTETSFVDEDVGVLENGFHRSGLVTKDGREVAAVADRTPSTTSRWVSIVLASSTVMTPSLPTFFIASAMICRWSRRCWPDGADLRDHVAGNLRG